MPAAATAEGAAAAESKLTSVTDRLPRSLPALHRPRDSRREDRPQPDVAGRSAARRSASRAINNVVDITNYVLMECGQPLHAFDFAKLAGQQDHRPRGARRARSSGDRPQNVRRSTPDMCVIADAEQPVALGGVMGGADSEVSAATTDVLIEAAAVRAALDPHHGPHAEAAQPFVVSLRARRRSRRVDWASRRALRADSRTRRRRTGRRRDRRRRSPHRRTRRSHTPLLAAQANPRHRCRPPKRAQILAALGLPTKRHAAITDDQSRSTQLAARSRRARSISSRKSPAFTATTRFPKTSACRWRPRTRSREDRVLERVRGSADRGRLRRSDDRSARSTHLVRGVFSPGPMPPPLRRSTPVLRRADRLRQPGAQPARRARHNESLANPRIELFEMANVYLPTGSGLPQQNRCCSRSPAAAASWRPKG